MAKEDSVEVSGIGAGIVGNVDMAVEEASGVCYMTPCELKKAVEKIIKLKPGSKLKDVCTEIKEQYKAEVEKKDVKAMLKDVKKE